MRQGVEAAVVAGEGAVGLPADDEISGQAQTGHRPGLPAGANRRGAPLERAGSWQNPPHTDQPVVANIGVDGG